MAHAYYEMANAIHIDYNNDNSVVIKGDVNGDGEVTIADVNAIIDIILGGTVNEDALNGADVNEDGEVTIADINSVIDIILGGGPTPNPDTMTFTVNGVDFKMVAVNGGTFTMGATSEQGAAASSNEYPTHQVALSDYFIGQTEVTQELWQAVMGSNPSNHTGDLQRPVECVSWDDCQTFVSKLNELTGKHFRLPTEAEWEYAARGGNMSKGFMYSGSNSIGRVSWYSDNSSNVTHAVAKKAPNELGLYDMSGNVYEWCEDWYVSSYPDGPQNDPTGPESGQFRVLRGGCFESSTENCRVSCRNYSKSGYHGFNLGLRLAFTRGYTAVPVISTQQGDSSVTITADGDGVVKLYVNGQAVPNPYVANRGVADYTITVYATAQEEGLNMSQSEMISITIPAMEFTAAPVISTETNEYAVTISAEGDGTVILYVNDQAVSNPYIASRSNSAYTIKAYATAKEEGKVISQSESKNIIIPAIEYTASPIITTQMDDTTMIVTATGIGIVKLYVNNQAVSNPYLAPRGYTDYDIMVYATAKEEGKVMSQSELTSITVPALIIEPIVETVTVNGVSFNMVKVEGGTFVMGATIEQSSDANNNEKPAHEVTVSSFSIGQTEVTQALWVAVMGNNPSHFSDNLNRPVECVSWNDCQTFITKLNHMTGMRFRLPTEAEWEFAARGGNMSHGYKYSGSNNVDDVCWYLGNIPSQTVGSLGYGTQPVATKLPNELWLYDMSGNVWEWCQDWFGSYSAEAQTDPTGPTTGTTRVAHGGSWYNTSPKSCRVSRRNGCYVTDNDTYLGLRLVLDESEFYTVNGVSFTMVPVKGGTFTMGASEEEDADYQVFKGSPKHQVTLSGYSIGLTEVTQELWVAVMGSNPSTDQSDLQYPVNNISWYDCTTFITKLNQITGKQFRLPTEAEWEYAAKGGAKSMGYVYSGSDNLDEVAWYLTNSGNHLHQVGTKKANELGLYDMSGNIDEWCNDWYSLYTEDPVVNPTGPETGMSRIHRGGRWNASDMYCRLTRRDGFAPGVTRNYLGLRLAL